MKGSKALSASAAALGGGPAHASFRLFRSISLSVHTHAQPPLSPLIKVWNLPKMPRPGEAGPLPCQWGRPLRPGSGIKQHFLYERADDSRTLEPKEERSLHTVFSHFYARVETEPRSSGSSLAPSTAVALHHPVLQKRHNLPTSESTWPCFPPCCSCGMLCRGNLGERPRSVQCDFLGFPGKICCWLWSVHSRVPWQIQTGREGDGWGCRRAGGGPCLTYVLAPGHLR